MLILPLLQNSVVLANDEERIRKVNEQFLHVPTTLTGEPGALKFGELGKNNSSTGLPRDKGEFDVVGE
jgi:hypothetical protein